MWCSCYSFYLTAVHKSWTVSSTLNRNDTHSPAMAYAYNGGVGYSLLIGFACLVLQPKLMSGQRCCVACFYQTTLITVITLTYRMIPRRHQTTVLLLIIVVLVTVKGKTLLHYIYFSLRLIIIIIIIMVIFKCYFSGELIALSLKNLYI